MLDENNIVTQVIVGKDENLMEDYEIFYSNLYNQKCKRTSYNTRAGVHLSDGIPFRKNYAGIGFFYDEKLDAFIPPKPFPSWNLNLETCIWEPPIIYPGDDKNLYIWDEENQVWILSQTTIEG